MAGFKVVASQRWWCQKEQIEYGEEKRQQGDVLFTDDSAWLLVVVMEGITLQVELICLTDDWFLYYDSTEKL